MLRSWKWSIKSITRFILNIWGTTAVFTKGIHLSRAYDIRIGSLCSFVVAFAKLSNILRRSDLCAKNREKRVIHGHHCAREQRVKIFRWRSQYVDETANKHAPWARAFPWRRKLLHSSEALELNGRCVRPGWLLPGVSRLLRQLEIMARCPCAGYFELNLPWWSHLSWLCIFEYYFLQFSIIYASYDIFQYTVPIYKLAFGAKEFIVLHYPVIARRNLQEQKRAPVCASAI